MVAVASVPVVASVWHPTGPVSHRLGNGETRQVEVVASSILFEGLPAALVMVTDVTERLAADAEQRADAGGPRPFEMFAVALEPRRHPDAAVADRQQAPAVVAQIEARETAEADVAIGPDDGRILDQAKIARLRGGAPEEAEKKTR